MDKGPQNTAFLEITTPSGVLKSSIHVKRTLVLCKVLCKDWAAINSCGYMQKSLVVTLFGVSNGTKLLAMVQEAK